MEKHEKILENIAIWLLAATGFLGLVVAGLDLLGTDFQTGPWAWIKGPTDVTLLIVSILALGLGLERYVLLKRGNTYEQISRKLSDLTDAQDKAAKFIIDSLDGVEIRYFDDEVAVMEYTNLRLQQAEIQVDDAGSLNTVNINKYRFDRLKDAYEEYMRHVVRLSHKIPYRDIFVFDRKSRKDRFQIRIGSGATGYSCSHFEKDIVRVPLLNFMIIDRQEVLFFSTKGGVSIKHHSVVSWFMQYFEELWSSSTILKLGYEFNWDEIARVLDAESVAKLRAKKAEVK